MGTSGCIAAFGLLAGAVTGSSGPVTKALAAMGDGLDILAFLNTPWPSLVFFALALAYLALGIRARLAAQEWAPTKGGGESSSLKLPRDVHPILAEALTRSGILRTEGNTVWPIERWTLAAALHALGTDGSVRIGPRRACGPTDTQSNSYRWTGDRDLYPALDEVEIERLRTPSDPTDAAVLEALLPSGAKRREALMEAFNKLSTSDRIPTDKLDEYKAHLTQEPDETAVPAATLLGMIGELHADYWTVLDVVRWVQSRLRSIVTDQGLLREEATNGKRKTSPGRSLGTALVLLHGLPGLIIFGNAGFGTLGTWAAYLGCLAIDMVTMVAVFPSEIPLTPAGLEIAGSASAVLAADPRDLTRLPERERLDAACMLLAHDAGSATAQGLAAALASEARPGSWQEAYRLLCAPVQTVKPRKKPISLAEAFASEMNTASIYESD